MQKHVSAMLVSAALDYYQVFAKRIKLLRPETQL